MTLDLQFSENNQKLDLNFNEVNNISDGGYERGYEAGYNDGEETGYAKGHTDGEEVGYNTGYADGLAKRTYETWTITLADGSIIEKEIALL